MHADLPSEVSDLLRRLHNIVKLGFIWEVDLPGGQLRVQLEDQLVTGWLPIPGEVTKNFTRWRPLDIGTRVMIACESGDLRNASIVQIFYSGSRPPPSDSDSLDLFKFIDEAEMSYDTFTHEMNVKLPPSASINIVADSGTVNISAKDGSINATADNGSVDISADNGTIKASATNGQISLLSDNGRIKCQSTNGQIDLLTTSGVINATCLQGFNILGDVNVVGTVNCTGDVNAKGDLNTEKDVNAVKDIGAGQNIKADGNIEDSKASMAQDRELYNVHQHPSNGLAPPTVLQ